MNDETTTHLTDDERNTLRRQRIEEMIAAQPELWAPLVSDGEPCPGCGQVHDRFAGPGFVTEWVIVTAVRDAGHPDPDNDVWILSAHREGQTRHHIHGLLTSLARRME